MPTITRTGFRGQLDDGIDLNSPDLPVDLAKNELDAAFRVVDGVDTNKKANSFLDAGAAGTDGPDYAKSEAPTSPLAGLSGNRIPGQTQPSWLKDQNKCNQFVGDALTQAGIEAPTVSMGGGKGVHYARAESWLTRHDLFDRITDPKTFAPAT